MYPEFQFTFHHIEEQYRAALHAGYTVMTCYDYYLHKQENTIPAKCLVNRVDIDMNIKKTTGLLDIFNKLNIKATFFLRLHAPEYNPFSFEAYRIVKRLINEGHELGYHSEVIDQAAIWNEDAAANLRRDIDIMQHMYGVKIKGVASHGGMTGLNNLDFWKNRKTNDFGLAYEAYDTDDFDLFHNSFYISDSEWTRWKCYSNGKKIDNDNHTLAEHVKDGHPLLYVLIHPDTYYHEHFYE